MQFEFLKTIVTLLADAEIPHMLAGSMASTFHGEPRMTRGVGGVELFVATAEDTVLSKFEWRASSDSERQFRDVVAVLSTQDLDRDYLLRWAAELGVAESLDEALIRKARPVLVPRIRPIAPVARARGSSPASVPRR